MWPKYWYMATVSYMLIFIVSKCGGSCVRPYAAVPVCVAPRVRSRIHRKPDATGRLSNTDLAVSSRGQADCY